MGVPQIRCFPLGVVVLFFPKKKKLKLSWVWLFLNNPYKGQNTHIPKIYCSFESNRSITKKGFFCQKIMLSIERKFATFVWICFPCRNNTSRTRFFLNDDAFTLGNLEEDLRRNFHSVSLITELKIKTLGTTLTKLSGKLQKIKIFNSSRCTGSRRIKDIWVFPPKKSIPRK